MFRKLRSNRDPQDTLLSEIKKEFGIYFNKIEHSIKSYISKHPVPLFYGMILLMALSFILSFTVFRGSEIKKDASKPAPAIGISQKNGKDLASEGFDKILQTGAILKETIKLKQEIQDIIAKEELEPEDNVRLEKALDRLEELNKSIK